jgi:osmoprotectant transport system substrate-binding protein
VNPRFRSFALLGLLLALSACASKPPRLKVGAKSGTDQILLGEILARHLENKLSVQVDRQFGMASTAVAHEALIGGQIDLYAEDAASAVTQVLHMDLGSEAMATYNLCRQQYGTAFQVDWLDPLGLESPLVLVARKELAEQIKGDTITLAAAAQIPFRLGASRDFNSRKDGYSQMQKIYNVRLRDAPRMANSAAELFKLLDDKQVDLIATQGASGYLASDHYLMLKDDQGVFQSSLTGVVLRRDAPPRFPGLEAALKQLTGKVSQAALGEMSQQVDAQKRPASDVAAGFLRAQGL